MTDHMKRTTISMSDGHRRLQATLAAGVGILLAASAAQAQVPAPVQDEPVALTGGEIHTVTNGVVENGTIIFEDGIITEVGSDVAVPADAEVVDVSGKRIYPGLIDGYNQMGLSEIGRINVTVDVNEIGDFNPNIRPEVAVNPDSRHIGTTRSAGILVSLPTPTGGRVSGLSSAIQMEGWTWEEMTLESGVALNVNWPNPQDEDQYDDEVEEIREIFATAKAYRDARDSEQRHDSDLRWEAMIPAVEGDMPVVVSASEIRAMQDAIHWAEEEGVDLILRGGDDARYVADQLVEKDIPVLLTSVVNAPSRNWEGYDGRYRAPAELQEAGVTFAIVGGSSAPYANRLPWEAGAAVTFGLSKEEAMEAVTIRPAEIFGIDDRVGSLEEGKHANLLITDGNPLDYLGTVEQAYIEGRELDMQDAHRQFFETYMEKVRQRELLQGGND